MAGPKVAEEIGGVDIAVFREEIAVATTAKHEVWVQFSTELGPALGEHLRLCASPAWNGSTSGRLKFERRKELVRQSPTRV